MTAYHIPVMLQECLEGLAIKPEGTYIDVTFGGGGHSKAILDQLGENGKLIAFDKDPQARENAEALNDSRLTLIAADFRNLKKYLKLYNIEKVDGLLADLGISSHQIDAAERGFSTRFDGPLDMRMNTDEGNLSAADVVNNYAVEDLIRIFKIYGELPNAKSIALEILRLRTMNPITTTQQFKEGLMTLAPKFKDFKFFAQVFQALRIEVNQELDGLSEMLLGCGDVVKKGGRLVVMSYHSLEDRLVKNYITKGNLEGNLVKDFYGNDQLVFKTLTRKPIEATETEISVNSRARSAKLRIAEKL